MATCLCSSPSCTQTTVEGVVICTCTTTIINVQCPENCTPTILPNNNVICGCVDIVAPTSVVTKTPISLTDPSWFEDVSFTLAFSPILNSWLSFYSFAPNYYVGHQNYFQTGLNSPSDTTERGLWSHLLTTQSYQVFYGKKQPWIVDYSTKLGYASKTLDSLSFNVTTRRFHDRYDWAEIENSPISSITIYNNTANSGELKLVNNTGAMSLIGKYPQTATNGQTQEILATHSKDNWNINYFYNRVIGSNRNLPIWNWDANQIDKTINYDIVKFKGKTVLEKMKGLFFNVRIKQDQETRFQYIYKFGITQEKQE
jgi:hypothetical protein